MRILLGIILVLGAIAVAGYVAGYIMLYGGIEQIIAGFEATAVIDGETVGKIDFDKLIWGIVRVMVTSFVTFFVFIIAVIPGAATLLNDDGR